MMQRDNLNELLADIAQQIKQSEEQIEHASEMIRILEQVGEPVAELRTQLLQAQARRARWVAMLKARGHLQ